MQLATQSDCLASTFGDEECIRILARAGFDAVDWSFFEMTRGTGVWCGDGWREHALQLKALGGQLGLGFVQAHAPFPSSCGSEPYDTEIFERIVRSMQAAALMGVPRIVVHPCHHFTGWDTRSRCWNASLAFYRRLLPYAERFGIQICLENMWRTDPLREVIIGSACSQPDEFCAMVDELSSPWAAACLDIGHSALVGVDPADFIRALGPRLTALHVHDVDRLHDCHTLPFLQKLDWEPIVAALARVGYAGAFTFEADSFLYGFPAELRPKASVLMAETGRYLLGRLEAARRSPENAG